MKRKEKKEDDKESDRLEKISTKIYGS